MLAVTIVVAVLSTPQAGGNPVTLESLLNEMIDRNALAANPEPAYTCRQFSSYDRRSTNPLDQSDEGWFANSDAGHYLRIEERSGRAEAVMVDAAGPGAVVRIWSANPKGTLRIYIDEGDDPVLETPMAALLSGEGVISPPLAATRARGANLYLPIPYAKRCVITTDDGEGMYYHINTRTYEEGTVVESIGRDSIADAADAIAATGRALLSEYIHAVRPRLTGSHGILPGSTVVAWEAANGPAAITTMTVTLNPDLSYGEVDLATLLRASILRIEFDGEQTVECPLGDFFGAGPSAADYHSWPFVTREARLFTSRWIMPFAKSARITITNHASAQLWAWVEVETSPQLWTDASMHFHADWRSERDMPTRPRRDWSYIEVSGRGVFVGDALSVTNPVEDWWGEGDEKIYVDGEAFPSHFGTGTEDYYGYAWCSSEVFEAPLHNQPRCDGPGNYGQTTINRFRALDAIPFKKSLKVDMEVWHWRECDVSYSAMTYWYGMPGATSNTPPITADKVTTLPVAPPLPPPFQIAGAIEGETLKILGKSGEFTAARQELWKDNTYSGDAHLWVQATRPGDWIDLEVPVSSPGEHRLVLHFTRSWDYAVIQPFINGEKAGEPIDTFNTLARDLGATGPIDLGQFNIEGRSFVLRLEVASSNPAAEGSGTFFGLDCIEVK